MNDDYFSKNEYFINPSRPSSESKKDKNVSDKNKSYSDYKIESDHYKKSNSGCRIVGYVEKHNR